MTPGLGMRLLSGPKGLECTNCSFDPRYVNMYDFVVEVAVVKCGLAVHEVRLCSRCIEYACKMIREVRREPNGDEEDDQNGD